MPEPTVSGGVGEGPVSEVALTHRIMALEPDGKVPLVIAFPLTHIAEHSAAAEGDPRGPTSPANAGVGRPNLLAERIQNAARYA